MQVLKDENQYFNMGCVMWPAFELSVIEHNWGGVAF